VPSGLLIEMPLTMGGLLAFGCSTLVKELLATIGLLAVMSGALVEEALCGSLVKKLLTTSDLLSLTSGFLIEMVLAGCYLLAMALAFPQFIHGTLPVLVGSLLMSATSSKNRPPLW
jgi:hypothetical protein